MHRTSASSLAATLQLAVLLAGVPVWLAIRFLQGPLAFQLLDIVLLTAVASWAVTVRAFATRATVLDPKALHSPTPTMLAHRVIDASIGGVGMVQPAEHATSDLHRLLQPQEVVTDQLPEPLAHYHFDQELEALLKEQETAAIPVITTQAQDDLCFAETHDHIVGRGDTFWSLAETFLGDGREWKQLHRLNLGRQVAADIVLDESHEQLRIGWSIQVPSSVPTQRPTS